MTHPFCSYSRIVIFGRPGSGKSTFAQHLAQQTGLPLHHLDRHFYLSNWKERDSASFLKRQQNIVLQEKWIIDGNNSKSLELRYQRANLVLYFNYPRMLCYQRAFKRYWQGKKRPDRPEGCPETLRWSLISYMWSFEERVAPVLEQLQKQYPHVTFKEIRSDRQLKQLEKELFHLKS